MPTAENSMPVTQAEEREPEQMTARQRAEALFNYLNHDKTVNDLFSDAFERQYLIYGKTPEQWRIHCKVSIPETPDPAQCKALASKLANIYQEVAFYHAASEAQLHALSSGEQREYTAAINRLMLDYEKAGKKRPGADVLKTMANSSILDLHGAMNNARIIRDFWKRMLDTLTETRKLLEQCMWNNNMIYKQELYGGGGNIPNTPTREVHGNGIAAEISWDV